MRSDGDVAAWAGGDRRTTRARMILSGFLAALKDAPAGAQLSVVAPRPDALVLHTLLKPPPQPPETDLDLRAALGARLAGQDWKLAVGDPAAATPLQFAAAWADLAGDKAKMGGAFSSAIPKTNLAKVKGL